MRLTLVLGLLLAYGNLVAAQCTKITDDFEDFASPGGITNPIPGAMSIGSYNGVIYKPFSSADAGPITTNVAGIIPASGTVVAAIGVTGDLLQVGVVTTHPFGIITAAAGQNFTLQSFSFACAANVVAGILPTGASQKCSVLVTGYGADGASNFTQSFVFVPDAITPSNMTLASISPDSAGIYLSKVKIQITDSQVDPVTAFLAVDDVVRCV